MSKKRTFIKIVIPLLIIFLGVAGARVMIKGRQPPAKQVKEVRGVLVKVITVAKSDVIVPVQATGTVSPCREVGIAAEVSGRVTAVNNLVAAGNFVKKDTLLFELQKVDYELALEKAKAEREKINLNLITLENQAEIARQEWQRLNPDREPHPLTVYGPQLANERAQLQAVEASIRQAAINLQRTKVYAPFSGLIKEENIAMGQYVMAGSTVCLLVDSAAAEIKVPLPPESLTWLTIPNQGVNSPGSAAVVSMKLGDKRATWHGRIVRSLGEVDPTTRMASVIVRVEDPYGLVKPHIFPLINNAFVDIEFSGTTVQGIEIPRAALRDSDTVWLLGSDNLLITRPVSIIRKLYDRVIIGQGLEPGERVVVSPLAGAADGMKLRPLEMEAGQ